MDMIPIRLMLFVFALLTILFCSLFASTRIFIISEFVGQEVPVVRQEEVRQEEVRQEEVRQEEVRQEEVRQEVCLEEICGIYIS
jgi:hypothetical protein